MVVPNQIIVSIFSNISNKNLGKIDTIISMVVPNQIIVSIFSNISNKNLGKIDTIISMSQL